MFDTIVMQAIETIARELEIEAAALAAVAHVESGLRTHALVDGRQEPLIRFEGHYFDRRLDGTARAQARQLGISSPTAGAIANPRAQAGRWALLGRAAQIDRKAAYESTSWGIGQVMGAHWAWLGYANVDALVAEARSGVQGQLRLMARYIEKAGLVQCLRFRDWHSFARGYNGPAYRKNSYHLKLAKAYEAYNSRLAAPQRTVLRKGARGEGVLSLQAALARHGYPLKADGHFGVATEQAVRRFQRDNRLVSDGIAGPATMAMLSRTSRTALSPAWIARFWKWLRRG